MGKTDRNRRKGKRKGKTGVQTFDEAAAAVAAAPAEMGILEQLASAETEQRSLACHSFATLFTQTTTKAILPQLLDGGLIRSVSACLISDDVSLMAAAAGALRNLATCGVDDICTKMAAEDVMGPTLIAFAKAVENAGSAEVTSDAARVELVQTLLEQLLFVMIHLTESSEDAVAAFTRKGVVGHVAALLGSDGPVSLTTAAAQLLAVVTDGNDAIVQQFMTPQSAGMSAPIEMINTAGGSDVPLLQVMSIATSLNLSGGDEFSQKAAAAVPLLCNVGAFDGVSALSALESALGSQTDDDDNDAAAGLSEWKTRMAATREALTVLANVACAACGPMGTAEGGDDVLLGVLQSSNVAQVVFPQCRGAPAGLMQTAAASPANRDALMVIASVQERALALVGNLVLALNFPEPNSLLWLWPELCGLADTIGSAAVSLPNVLEATLSAMGAVARRATELFPANFEVSPDHVTALSNLATGCGQAAVRLHAVTILGCLGTIPTYASSIAPALMDVLIEALGDESAWVVAEALTAFFNVFAETDYNEIVVAKNMMSHLSQCVPRLKSLMSDNDVRGDYELLGTLDDALSNLERFIDYKRAQGV